MKKILYRFSLVLLAIITFSGCDSFLDVNPAGKVTQDKMFEDIQGYRDAMYGIYASMAQSGLYGENLSFGFVEQLGQLFYPSHTLGDYYQKVQKIQEYNYADQAVKPIVEGIWANSYKCISYINNVLENIASVNLDADPDYRLIKGESYALRAFLHFDIVRLYCDDIRRNPTAGGIPYAYTFDLQNKQLFTLKETYENILEDLNTAQYLLANDTLLSVGGNASAYRNNRYTQVNLYAVYGIKARVFRFKGDLDSAGIYAEKIISSSQLHLINSHNDLKTAKKYPGSQELIWGLFNNKLYTPLYKIFIAKRQGTGSDTRLEVRKDYEKIYKETPLGPDDHDYRYDEFFDYVVDSTNISFSRFLEEEVSNSSAQEQAIKGICLLRLPEMYYIAAEALYESNPTQAIAYFNAVRNSRGLMDMQANRLDSKDKFRQELMKERLKEFWGEGQTFFEHKYQYEGFTSPSKVNVTIDPSNTIFILPWPEDEKEFGNTNQ